MGLCIFLGVVGVICLVVGIMFKSSMEQIATTTIKIIGGIAVVGSIIVLLVCSFYTVNPGEVGVEVFFGKIVKYAENGFHVKNPFSNIIPFDVKTVKEEYKSEGASKDLQKVDYNVAINYHLDYNNVGNLYQKVGHDYSIKVIAPAVQESIKSCSSMFAVEEIITKRMELKDKIFDLLKSRLSNYNIILENVNLNDISFTADFNKVVEEKQVQEQKVKTAEYRRQQAEKDKETAILQAQAEAEKQRLLRNSVSTEVIQLKLIEKWDGHYPTVMGGNGGMILQLPATK